MSNIFDTKVERCSEFKPLFGLENSEGKYYMIHSKVLKSSQEENRYKCYKNKNSVLFGGISLFNLTATDNLNDKKKKSNSNLFSKLSVSSDTSLLLDQPIFSNPNLFSNNTLFPTMNVPKSNLFPNSNSSVFSQFGRASSSNANLLPNSNSTLFSQFGRVPSSNANLLPNSNSSVFSQFGRPSSNANLLPNSNSTHFSQFGRVPSLNANLLPNSNSSVFYQFGRPSSNANLLPNSNSSVFSKPERVPSSNANLVSNSNSSVFSSFKPLESRNNNNYFNNNLPTQNDSVEVLTSKFKNLLKAKNKEEFNEITCPCKKSKFYIPKKEVGQDLTIYCSEDCYTLHMMDKNDFNNSKPE